MLCLCAALKHWVLPELCWSLKVKWELCTFLPCYRCALQCLLLLPNLLFSSFFFKFVLFLIYKSGWIKLIHSYFYFCCCISPYDWLQDHLIIFFCLSHTGHVLYYMPGLCIFAYLDSLAVILIARVTLVISDNPGFSIHVKGWYWQRSAMTNTDECTSQGW